MATATERVPVLMTPAEKKRVVSKAKKAGLTTGEYMRRAAEEYRPSDDDKALEAIISEMNIRRPKMRNKPLMTRWHLSQHPTNGS